MRGRHEEKGRPSQPRRRKDKGTQQAEATSRDPKSPAPTNPSSGINKHCAPGRSKKETWTAATHEEQFQKAPEIRRHGWAHSPDLHFPPGQRKRIFTCYPQVAASHFTVDWSESLRPVRRDSFAPRPLVAVTLIQPELARRTARPLVSSYPALRCPVLPLRRRDTRSPGRVHTGAATDQNR